MSHGKFIISLDFELFWGVRDTETVGTYGENIKGVHVILPRMLDLFAKYDIRVTFAVVGFLFCRSKQDLLNEVPVLLPQYDNAIFSPYNRYLDEIGNNAAEDPYHFGFHLLEEIKKYPEHEIASHTYSHYYCLEKGQTIEAFVADIQKAKKVANNFNSHLQSLVFPRSQVNTEYIKVLKNEGFLCYRGTEKSWMYKARMKQEESLIIRAARLADSYINISGHNCYSDEFLKSTFPVNIPSSRFLRPFSKKLSFFDKLKYKRIESGMKHAALKNYTYHLWWHPHNFGIHQDENLNFLEDVLICYKSLKEAYNFKNYTMSALAKEIIHKA